VKNWGDGTMKKRWIAAGMLEAERSFRRVKGHADMPALVAATQAEVLRRTAASQETDRAVA
jgi:hypothetical protein